MSYLRFLTFALMATLVVGKPCCGKPYIVQVVIVGANDKPDVQTTTPQTFPIGETFTTYPPVSSSPTFTDLSPSTNLQTYAATNTAAGTTFDLPSTSPTF